MTRDSVERYLTDLSDVRGTRSNVPETSFYPALERLLTEVGQTLSPKVRCVINLANRGAGIPDGGLFTADQFKRKGKDAAPDGNPFPAQLPARGVIEAKAPAADVKTVAVSEQVGKYWKHYGLVLVTNFRAFTLMGRDDAGQPVALESFALGGSEAEFWQLAAHPRKTADLYGERLLEYLKRVLLHNAPLTAPQDVAALLASYAHDARLRIEHADLPAITSLRGALEEALGLRFEDAKGEHFFRSTLIQTLFYGVFSAWVLWSRRRAKVGQASQDVQAGMPAPLSFAQAIRNSGTSYHAGGPFDWRVAHHLLRVPILRALFTQVADPARLGALGLTEVLDWTAAALNRVDRAQFFASFDEGHAVQYFYEPFLEAFDPALRKELGVWYTPDEIVRYQVERVDAVLRSELGLADGLADPQVVVLDPCCGTGAYLRAVLRRIAATLHEKGGDALVAHDLKLAAMTRVLGFEIMPAPFVIAHLQIGLELETLGAPLSDADDNPERAAVYLTNSLTGWEPPKEKPKQIAFPGFDEERDAAGKVKHDKPILVILGNPPYNGFAGVSPEEENGLVEPYKKGLASEWGIKKYNLDELYVRFVRLAEKRVAEFGGRGVVSFISSFSYLGDASFVVMRKRLLGGFDSIWLDCLNGDSRETGKRTPSGTPDPSVFSTQWNREGIKLGTSVGLFVKRDRKHKHDAVVRFRHFWGTRKRDELEASLKVKKFDAAYEVATPTADNRWSFRPSDVGTAYLSWPKLTEICGQPPSNGLMEKRGGALMDADRNALAERMRRYFDEGRTFDSLKAEGHPLTRDAAAHDASRARAKAITEEGFIERRLQRYALRPFDTCWCYYTNESSVWNRARPSLWAQCWEGNSFLLSRFNSSKDDEGVPFYFAGGLSDDHSLSPDAAAFALRLRSAPSQAVALAEASLPGMEADAPTITANLSPPVRAYLNALGFPDPDADQPTAELVWFHALAIGFSPAYLTENADGIAQDWPRIPLPAFGTVEALPQADRDRLRDLLTTSAELGRQVAALLDTESPVPGVTSGTIQSELRAVAVFRRFDGKPANPDAGDLDLTAGWGHAGKGGVTMPGRGKVRESGTGVREPGIGEEATPDSRLPTPVSWDIHLNERCCWRNVPAPVWEYTIGGYQVLKKWLSYREKPLLGRGLLPDEVRHFTDTARRLAALLALHPALDENYRAAAGAAVTGQ